eukprot:CAMPEP_0175852742 /NCGR_PEP_ID=MMETSP0107_2-20121207/26380_1 /TAXON_ID=195067 ORGANISM="Goniomonas pacifica, Strain CCMP1869" /NCGR_SAMPLE_ID=MMETSP0107_2 /ASSEMBLY_ACC=CAM_ASM_000203 /LENGTH=148 /DNA_ID=CAMNT_0017168307 /DNA_START=163 /DNA_END=608 /DNA_ORIENTATION=+
MNKNTEFWAYGFYISKYVEFLDTQSSSTGSTTSSLPRLFGAAWKTPFTIGYTGPVTNSFVHILMYAYYFITDFNKGFRVFGPIITPIQIVQFMFCLTLWTYEFTHNCGGNERSLIWIGVLYVAFLGLFLKMYLERKAERKAARQAKSQ